MTDLERVTPASVEAAVKLWSASSFLPAHYRNPDGSVKEGDLRIACARLDGLGLDPRLNLDGVFVVGGKPQLMADIQRALARRAGWDIEPVSWDENQATVRIRPAGSGREWQSIRVTMAQAEKAGWTKRNPSYQTMPDRMLLARACTQAISLIAPGALRGIDYPEDLGDDLSPADVAQDGPAVADTEKTPGVADAPAGPTNPPENYPPKPAEQARPEVRRALHRALDTLDERQRNYVYQEAKDANMPNLDGPRFTHGHAAGLAMLIFDAQDHPFGPTTEQIDAALAAATVADDVQP